MGELFAVSIFFLWIHLAMLLEISTSAAAPDPGSGAFLTPESGMGKIRIWDKCSGSYFWELSNNSLGWKYFLNLLSIQCCGSGSGIRHIFYHLIRNPRRKKYRSGMNNPDPQHNYPVSFKLYQALKQTSMTWLGGGGGVREICKIIFFLYIRTLRFVWHVASVCVWWEWINVPNHISECLATIFWVKKILKFVVNSVLWIRDQVLFFSLDPESGRKGKIQIRNEHPRSAIQLPSFI